MVAVQVMFAINQQFLVLTVPLVVVVELAAAVLEVQLQVEEPLVQVLYLLMLLALGAVVELLHQ